MSDRALEIVAQVLGEAWGDVTVYRTRACVTFRAGRLERWRTVAGSPLVQVILRRYESVSEVIHRFDIGASAVVYDGQQVWFTSLSKLAYEQGVNVLDLSRRRANYEARLAKYFLRGFGIVLPNLDAAKVAKEHAAQDPGGVRKWTAMGRLGFNTLGCPGDGRITACNLLPISCRSWREEENKATAERVAAAARAAAAPEAKVAAPEAKAAAAEEPRVVSNAEAGGDVEDDYGLINYDSMSQIVMKNFMSTLRSPVPTNALCGWRTFTRLELGRITIADIRGIEVRFDTLGSDIQSCASVHQIDIKALEVLVGHGTARALVNHLLDGRDVNYGELADQLVAIVKPLTVVPFAYMAPDELTCTSQKAASGMMPLSEWYGAYYLA